MHTPIDAFVMLLAETEDRIGRIIQAGLPNGGDQGLRCFLADFRRMRLNPLFHKQKHVDTKRYVFSLVGLTNVGKSTLVEALLGQPVAPRLNGPATSIPVEYEHGATWTMKVHSSASMYVKEIRYPSVDLLAKALEAQVLCQSPESAQDIGRAFVAGPMDLLKDGLVLADTPGFGAAHPDGTPRPAGPDSYVMNDAHEVCFCISGANCTVKSEEVGFFATLREKCTTVVVTKWDSDPGSWEEDAQRWRSRYGHLFPVREVIFTQAKPVTNLRNAGIALDPGDSSLQDLCALIRQRATAEARRLLLRAEVAKAWRDLNELAGEPLHKAGLLEIPWHQDALDRFRAVAEREGIELDGD